MNANQITTILFVLAIAGTILNAILPMVPAEQAVFVTLALGIISEFVNFFQSGYEPKPVEE